MYNIVFGLISIICGLLVIYVLSPQNMWIEDMSEHNSHNTGPSSQILAASCSGVRIIFPSPVSLRNYLYEFVELHWQVYEKQTIGRG
jgi:hypothetical protein